MQRLARSKQCSRTGSLTARKRRSRLPRTRYLANPASLIGIPRLEAAHAGNKISFGSSALTALAQTLVEIDLATNPTGSPQRKLPPHWSSKCSAVIWPTTANPSSLNTSNFLTLGEAIVDSQSTAIPSQFPGQLFFVLNTESSFALGVGDAITELEGAIRHGSGVLRHSAPAFIPLDPCL
jgi:hypothetical protein